MVINFPKDPADGKIHPELGTLGPGELQYQYDRANNSWNIIAPDNVATTDYVDGKIGDDQRNIRRNYDLHQSTNTLSYKKVFAEHEVIACNNSFKSSLLAELLYEGETLLDTPNDINEVIASGYTVPEWGECVDGTARPADTFSYMAMNQDNQNLSRNIKHIICLSFNDVNATTQNFIVGSTIEIGVLGQSKNGFDDYEYAVYKILSAYKYTSTVAIGVQYIGSYSVGDGEVFIPVGQDHNFTVYSPALEKTGGKVDGKLKIVGDAVDIFSVWRNDTDNPYRILNVNSTDNDITLNDDYNLELQTTTGNALNKNLVATVGYVHDRLGISGIYTSNSNGPFVRLRSDTMTGALKIQTTVSEGAPILEIHGKPTRTGSAQQQSRRPMVTVITNAGGDYLEYEGLCTRPKEVTTVTRVNELITNSSLATDLNKKVNKAGDQLTGKLYYDRSYTYGDKDLIPFEVVKELTTTRVIDNPPNVNSVESGYLYEKNGQLYYKTYRD